MASTYNSSPMRPSNKKHKNAKETNVNQTMDEIEYQLKSQIIQNPDAPIDYDLL